MKLRSCSAEEFKAAITDNPADKFAKTFVAKANMQNQWDFCIGAWEDDILLGAIITTISKRAPRIANLQLLHTFAEHRGKHVGTILCKDSLRFAIQNDALYFRVSAEPDAVKFYERIGFTMLGKQKSGSQLSMFRIEGDTFETGDYSLDNEPIYNAVHKKGKGGCVEIFASDPVGITNFLI